MDINVSLVDHMGDDLSVVNAARVSYSKKATWGWNDVTYLKDKDVKLVNYLAKHNHWSPFGHASMQFHIKAPVFVARQLVKHQVGLVWNEVSRRYVDDEPEFYEPEEWRGRPQNSKQGSSDEVIDINPSGGSGPMMVNDYQQAIRSTKWAYEELLRKDVDELALFEKELKGELTVVISENKIGKKLSQKLSESDMILINKMIDKYTIKEITDMIIIKSNISKKEIYNYCLKLKNEN